MHLPTRGESQTPLDYPFPSASDRSCLVEANCVVISKIRLFAPDDWADEEKNEAQTRNNGFVSYCFTDNANCWRWDESECDGSKIYVK